MVDPRGPEAPEIPVFRPFRWTRVQYAFAAGIYFVLISLLSANVPDKLFEFLPDLEFVRFVRSLVTNLAHVPLFGGFAFFVIFAIGGDISPFRLRPFPYWATLSVTLVCGLIDELHQAFVPGRFPSHLDIALDVIGGLFACFVASALAEGGTSPDARRVRVTVFLGRRLVLRSLGLGALALVFGILAVVSGHRSTLPWRRFAQLVFPVPETGLMDGFERENVWRGAGPREARLTREDFEIRLASEDWTREGKTSLWVTLPTADWAGISTREVPVDLSGFSGIQVDLYWPEDAPLDVFGIRMIDYDGTDAEAFVRVVSGVQTVSLGFEDLSDSLDMTRIDILCLIVRNHGSPMTLGFDRLILLGSESPLGNGPTNVE